jgi:hypothetical protein
MSDYIYQQSTPIKTNETEELLYTTKSYAEFIDDDDNPRTNNEDLAFAQIKKRPDGSVRYMIKLNAQSKPYNILSIYGESSPSKFLDTVCRQQHKYKSVNMNVFEMYLKFLKTENLSWLHYVEREMI